MSKINDLIKELCPNGVEYKYFYSVAKYIRGITYNKSNETEEVDSYKVLRANNITLDSNKLNFEDVKKVHKFVRVKDEQWLKKGDILICAGSGSKEHIGKVAYIAEDIDYTFGGFMGVIRCNKSINSSFMFHILTSNIFREHIGITINSTTINNINNQTFENLSIPIPPLEVQEEIIRILDKFGELEAELEAELETRKSQYEFWRGNLLKAENSNIVKINDITNNVSSGKCSSRNEDGKYPVYGSTGIIAKTDEFAYDTERLLVARVGANAGFVHIATGKYDVTDNTLIVDLKENVDLKYMYYYLQNFNLNKIAKGGGQPLITGGQIKDLEINLPPLSEQKRIANILDKFDKLINDISEGLPAEIELRRKQYEYYRNKLLTFEELSVSE